MSRPPKNIVICCDGTGNDYSHTESNVMRLFRLALKNDPRQVACYHPGIGTLPRPEGRTEPGRTLRRWTSLWLGTGAIENVVALYSYLMRVYEPGDRSVPVRVQPGCVHRPGACGDASCLRPASPGG